MSGEPGRLGSGGGGSSIPGADPTSWMYVSLLVIKLAWAFSSCPRASARRDSDWATSVRVRSPIWKRSRVASRLTRNTPTCFSFSETIAELLITFI